MCSLFANFTQVFLYTYAVEYIMFKCRRNLVPEALCTEADVLTFRVSSNSQSAGNAECKQEDSDEEDDKKYVI